MAIWDGSGEDDDPLHPGWPTASIPLAVSSFVLSDSISPTVFDDLMSSAVDRFGVRYAELTITADNLVWVKAALGSAAGTSSGAENDLCGWVAKSGVPLVIEDALAEPELAARFPAISEAGLRFYAGVPLITTDGFSLGAMCVWDTVGRTPTESDLRSLHQTAKHAMALIEQHKAVLDLQQERSVLAATGKLLAMIVGGSELPIVLHTLAKAVEAAMPETLCSVLLLDGNILRHGAGPSLPQGYLDAIDGTPIGPTQGSCGTAAYTRKTVIVSDIQTDFRWVKFRELAASHYLRACWSVPVVASDENVLGTFALYYREARQPTVTELQQLDRWMNLAEVAITRARDISDLRTAATRDPLTGLTNRVEALRQLRIATVRAVARGSSIGVLFIDLDQFKFVNDTLGHLIGDEFLRTVALRLRQCAGSGNIVARFGGDEFLVLCPDLTNPSEAEALAREVVVALQAPMNIGGRTLSLSASIGVSSYRGSDGEYSLDPIGDADLAMYAAKRSGRNSVAIFTPDLRESAVERLSLEAELSLALVNSEFSCAYQPTIDLQTGQVVAIEALLRWTSPLRGEVPPLSFIPVAEDSGLIAELGEYVLRNACEQLASWRQQSSSWAQIRVWVNVTVRQLGQQSFPDTVARILEGAGITADSLGLEVTESAFVSDVPGAIGSLIALRRLGVHVAIDDFGTGYSSLSQLKHLPVDALKIDKQFIADMGTVHSDSKIVEAILVLARSLNLMVIAEGVETEAQLLQLNGLGCRYAQGRLWSMPVAPAMMQVLAEKLMDSNRSVVPAQAN